MDVPYSETMGVLDGISLRTLGKLVGVLSWRPELAVVTQARTRSWFYTHPARSLGKVMGRGKYAVDSRHPSAGVPILRCELGRGALARKTKKL